MIAQIFPKAGFKSCVKSFKFEVNKPLCVHWASMQLADSERLKNLISENSDFFMLITLCIFDSLHNFFVYLLSGLDQEANYAVQGKEMVSLEACSRQSQEL